MRALVLLAVAGCLLGLAYVGVSDTFANCRQRGGGRLYCAMSGR